MFLLTYYCVIGFRFKPLGTVTETSFKFGSSAAAVNTESCQSSASTGFVFSNPLQLGPAATNTSAFSFKPPQSSSASENKGER